jgi:hypothetical protein
MSEQPDSPIRPPLSPAERSQIKQMVRFLAIVLFFVIAASLSMAFIINVFGQ